MAIRSRRFTSDRLRVEKNVVADLVIGSWHRTIPLEGEAGRLFLQRRVFVFVRLMGVLALALVAINSLTERRSFAASLPKLVGDHSWSSRNAHKIAFCKLLRARLNGPPPLHRLLSRTRAPLPSS